MEARCNGRREGRRRPPAHGVGRGGNWELAAHLDGVDLLPAPAAEVRMVKVGRSTVVEEVERGREGATGVGIAAGKGEGG